MQSPVLERLVGGAVLVGLLLLLALAIGPRDVAQMPTEEVVKTPVVSTAADTHKRIKQNPGVFAGAGEPAGGQPRISAPESVSSSTAWTVRTDEGAGASDPAPDASADADAGAGVGVGVGVGAGASATGASGGDAQAAPVTAGGTRGAAESPQAPAAAPGGSAATGRWAVQIGSFARRDYAERLSEWCREQGYGVKVLPLSRGKQTLYRVRVGPYASRAGARSAAAELAQRGRGGFLAEWEDSTP